MATDGKVGVVKEFLVDPADGHLTHLVLREGHLWGQKDATIAILFGEEVTVVAPDGTKQFHIIAIT